MPTYQYVCTECGDQVEAVQKFTDDPLTVHTCGGRLRKVFSPVGIVFKGSGFYRTDSRKGSSASTPASSSSSESSSSAGDKKTGDGDKKAGEKPSSSSSSTSSSSSSGSSSARSSSGSSGEKVA
ncbi:MAG TPA: FmdB family zinc ribbon protein [Trebonia sp.]|nr:FmdB family zinc ribbon protein [Trebonia sp.]